MVILLSCIVTSIFLTLIAWYGGKMVIGPSCVDCGKKGEIVWESRGGKLVPVCEGCLGGGKSLE